MEAVVRRNLPAIERRKEMLEAALDIFSRKGQCITVQELADRIGVTQPLVHRYFPVKADLINAIREALQTGTWNPAWDELLSDKSLSIEERLVTFYGNYIPDIYEDRWFRGFNFAALDEPAFARHYLEQFRERFLIPVSGAVRERFGYPDFDTIPLFGREIEMAWSLHSTAAIMGTRKHIYQMPIQDDMLVIIRDQIEAYLYIAQRVLSELMPQQRLQATA